VNKVFSVRPLCKPIYVGHFIASRWHSSVVNVFGGCLPGKFCKYLIGYNCLVLSLSESKVPYENLSKYFTNFLISAENYGRSHRRLSQ